MPVNNGNCPVGSAVGVITDGHVGVGAPNAVMFAVLAKMVCCCSPLVVTDPTWLSMFCRAK